MRRYAASTLAAVAAFAALVGLDGISHMTLLALGACLGLVRLPPLRAPEPVLSK